MRNQLHGGFLEAMAGKFRLLADATRLAIVHALTKEGERSVGAVAEATGHTLANVSKHLRLLSEPRW